MRMEAVFRGVVLADLFLFPLLVLFAPLESTEVNLLADDAYRGILGAADGVAIVLGWLGLYLLSLILLVFLSGSGT